mmetsp:Transcript_22997/g.42328  ORF Transcript_22997/g.42328 Transcript_22997/m.42328 type:complete len:272 (-) Transcript_22997:51-866(-)
MEEPLLAPKTDAFQVPDPRQSNSATAIVGVVAFYYPGKNEPCDDLCKAPFLGNFYEDYDEPVRLDRVAFRNAEGAFQALKFWQQASKFGALDGESVFRLKKEMERSGKPDLSYHGYGNNWKGMLAVLRAKFKPGSKFAQGLLATSDAFLLEHNSVKGRDAVWSNNHIGDGTNWLGMQLMLLRDELQSGALVSLWSGPRPWTRFIRDVCKINLDNGQPQDGNGANIWSQLVKAATDEAIARLPRVTVAQKLESECPCCVTAQCSESCSCTVQ